MTEIWINESQASAAIQDYLQTQERLLELLLLWRAGALDLEITVRTEGRPIPQRKEDYAVIVEAAEVNYEVFVLNEPEQPRLRMQPEPLAIAPGRGLEFLPFSVEARELVQCEPPKVLSATVEEGDRQRIDFICATTAILLYDEYQKNGVYEAEDYQISSFDDEVYVIQDATHAELMKFQETKEGYTILETQLSPLQEREFIQTRLHIEKDGLHTIAKDKSFEHQTAKLNGLAQRGAKAAYNAHHWLNLYHCDSQRFKNYSFSRDVQTTLTATRTSDGKNLLEASAGRIEHQSLSALELQGAKTLFEKTKTLVDRKRTRSTVQQPQLDLER